MRGIAQAGNDSSVMLKGDLIQKMKHLCQRGVDLERLGERLGYLVADGIPFETEARQRGADSHVGRR